MSRGVQPKGEKVRNFLIQSIIEQEPNLVALTARKFGISRQGVNQHIERLRNQGNVHVGGTRRSPKYSIVPISTDRRSFVIEPGIEEHEVWESFVKPSLRTLPANVLNIWNYGFTEMFNNAIDHSDGKSIWVVIEKAAMSTKIQISDDGVGIFKKIKNDLKLDDERHAIFELSKGKLTTDPKNHTGQGIFFTSRMVDHFSILSGQLYFSHKFEQEDWLLDDGESHEMPGTGVFMTLNNHSSRTTKKIFDQYSGDDGDYRFNKTVIPINLANYGAESLVSRSQAKRVLARVDQFERVVLNFEGVSEIGQGFADQIFRVYANEHPEIQMTCIHANESVTQMIKRAIQEKEQAAAKS